MTCTLVLNVDVYIFLMKFYTNCKFWHKHHCDEVMFLRIEIILYFTISPHSHMLFQRAKQYIEASFSEFTIDCYNTMLYKLAPHLSCVYETCFDGYWPRTH